MQINAMDTSQYFNPFKDMSEHLLNNSNDPLNDDEAQLSVDKLMLFGILYTPSTL